MTHERVEALIEDVCERAAEAGVVVGAFADTPAIANRWIDAGVQYVTLGVEAGLFTEHLSSLAADVETT